MIRPPVSSIVSEGARGLANERLSVTLVALAACLCCAAASAQTGAAAAPSSADLPEAKSLFETGNQATISPRPFASFLERISSPVEKIEIKANLAPLAADGVGRRTVSLRLLGKDGVLLKDATEVTIEATGGVRVLLPGRSTDEAGPGRGDLDKLQSGTQLQVKNGEASFDLIAPYQPEEVTLRVSVKGVAEKIVLRYVPDLREMIAVGLLEGRLRSDRFDPRQLVPARQDDGFEQELKSLTREFNGGKGNFGARAALYLKGKVKGEYLLTLAYDSDKETSKKLFNTIDPNAFYPVYGDASVRGADAQSAHKLFVRLDKGTSYALYGDYSTQDPNPSRALSQYVRSMPGLKAHYEEGAVVANVFAAQQTFRQIVDEFPGRGVSGPYAVSNPNGVANTERVELIIRSRHQTTQILKVTPLTRSADYEFEVFSGRIVFRSPVPSVDDQLNPVSIRITYEVEQGGERFMVTGGDVKLKLSEQITIGASAAKDNNPAAPFEVQGLNVALKLSKHTEVIAELARSQSVVNTGASGFNTNVSGNFAGKSGEFTGQAARVELRHADDDLRARVAIAKSTPDFNNPGGGMTGGKSDATVNLGYKVTQDITANAELQRTQDDVTGANSTTGQLGADLRLSKQLTVGAGARRVRQNSASLQETTLSNCSPSTVNAGQVQTTAGNVAGYNTGFGIDQVGNQRIDPATGQLVICNSAIALVPTAAPPTSVDRSQGFLRAVFTPAEGLSFDGEISRVNGTDPVNLYKLGGRWQATKEFALSGNVQREFSGNSQAQYNLGADWALGAKTRLYARYEQSKRYAGQYGLGTGPISQGLSMGFDSQYMEGGSVYSEYRIRDSGSGKEIQHAIGLRNGFTLNLAEGVKLLTSAERLNSSSGQQTALGLGLEYTADPLWKGSTRIEWRQDASNINWLYTLNVSRKLDREWTLIGKEYLNLVDPRTAGLSNKYQNRAQVGFAYRPVDNNRFDALGFYENRHERDLSAGSDRTVDIISVRGNYHPNRAWWVSARYALKRVDELIEGTVRDNYTAQLMGARITYDITNRWTLGGQLSLLQGTGGAKQYGYGLEAGYILRDNLWLTVGYNWRGYSDKDFSANEYTNRGWVMGLRYKFDEDFFRSDDPSTNKALSPKTTPNSSSNPSTAAPASQASKP